MGQDNEERNFYCLWLLLMSVGHPNLRKYFKYKWDSTPGYKHWTDCPQDGVDLMRLWKPKILPYEKPKVSSGDTSAWDLSLIVKILLSRVSTGVAIPKSARKALEKLKELRNTLCHTKNSKITIPDFNGMWSDACNALKVFGAKSKDFKSVKRDAEKPLTDLISILEKWIPQEKELLNLLNEKSTLLTRGQLALQRGQSGLYRLLLSIQQGLSRPESQIPYDPEIKNSLYCRSIWSAHVEEKYLKEHYQTGDRPLAPPLPYMEGPQFHIQVFWTTLTLLVMHTSQVASMNDIFSEKSTNKKKVRRILIEGEAGIGKSTLCKKIAFDWSMGQKPNTFPHFKMVFLLKCIDFLTGDLWDAIEEQNIPEDLKEKKKEIFEYIKNNQQSVLFVLDGYDEIPKKCEENTRQSINKLISGQLLQKCYVIVTSRSEKSSEIHNKFDKNLKMEGFDPEDSFSFIRKFFSSSPETADAAIESIKRVEAVRDLVRSPLYTAIFCLTLKENKDDRELSLGTLCSHIVVCVMKRYYVEKLREKVNDTNLQNELHNKLYLLEKMAFSLIKEARNEFEESELTVELNSVGAFDYFVALYNRIVSWIKRREEKQGEKENYVALMSEFLVHGKPVNKVKTDSSYSFPYAPVKEHLAANFIKESFRNGSLPFSISPFKDCVTFWNFLCFLFTMSRRHIEDQRYTWRDWLPLVLCFALYFFVLFGYV